MNGEENGMRTRFYLAWAAILVGGGLAPGQERFDPMTLDIQRVGEHWQVRARQRVLKEFKRHEDAETALRILRELRINQQVSIGSPRPVIECWLSDGRAPVGLSLRRLPTIPFDGKSLKVESKQGHWVVRDASRPLFAFGTNEANAHQALELLKQHDFNRVGYVGDPPVMMYFVADPKVQQRPGPASTGPASPLASMPLPTLGMRHPFEFAMPEGEDREAITWQRCELFCDNAAWKLVEGKRTLLELGRNPKTARDALQVLRHYRFTEQCRTGTSPMSFRCFLVDGQAPRGLMFGMPSIAFQPDQLTVRQQGNAWVICQGDHALMPAGASAEEAKHALRIIKTYGFDRLCWVGDPNGEGFRFLVRHR
jgi:hypothetical protein